MREFHPHILRHHDVHFVSEDSDNRWVGYYLCECGALFRYDEKNTLEQWTEVTDRDAIVIAKSFNVHRLDY